ncbi:MAG: hypothetical protein E6G97_19365 [Alphaproteobacteria bacterium]|nr:MAG: hypothetical protein E6G97_19365 [Alphaproteobacteria bacterium]
MLRRMFVMATFGTYAALAACATIVHNGPRAISVASSPTGAKVSVYDRSNVLVQTNTTPFVAQLNTKYRYFKGQTYRLVFELPGHANAEVRLDSSLSRWYFGNIVFGGLIGMLIVDPLTGAMYNLTPEKIEQPLSATQAQVIRVGKGLLVVLASQTTVHEREQMVRVN